MNGAPMETCPACLGPNPDCDTCHGAGEVTTATHAAFTADRERQEALWDFRHAVDDALIGAESVDAAKDALAALLT